MAWCFNLHAVSARMLSTATFRIQICKRAKIDSFGPYPILGYASNLKHPWKGYEIPLKRVWALSDIRIFIPIVSAPEIINHILFKKVPSSRLLDKLQTAPHPIGQLATTPGLGYGKGEPLAQVALAPNFV